MVHRHTALPTCTRTSHGCPAPGPREEPWGDSLGPQSEAPSELPRSLEIGREDAADSERLVRGVCRKASPITSLFFSFLHSFHFVHLGRKTFLTASKQRVLREAGAAVGGRYGLQKPTCEDHIDMEATWASLGDRAVDSADRSTGSLGAGMCCAAPRATQPS